MTRERRAEALEAKRRFWRQHIESWKRCGQQQSAYCRRHKLKLHCFIYWKKRYRDPNPPAVSFVEVKLPSAATEAMPAAGHRPLRLLVSKGHCVEIERDFDPVALRRLLQILERL